MITEIMVTVGRTVNLGNYESARFEVTLKDSLDEPVPSESKHTRAKTRELFDTGMLLVERAIRDHVKDSDGG